jgi:hypothetical protein
MTPACAAVPATPPMARPTARSEAVKAEEKGDGDAYGVVGEEDDGGGEGLATDASDDGL